MYTGNQACCAQSPQEYDNRYLTPSTHSLWFTLGPQDPFNALSTRSLPFLGNQRRRKHVAHHASQRSSYHITVESSHHIAVELSLHFTSHLITSHRITSGQVELTMLILWRIAVVHSIASVTHACTEICCHAL